MAFSMLLLKALTVFCVFHYCAAYYGSSRNTITGSDSIIVEAPQSTVSNNDVVYYPSVNLPANCRMRCVKTYPHSNQVNPTTRCVVVRMSSAPSSSRSTSYSTFSSNSYDRNAQSYTPSRSSYSTYANNYGQIAQDYTADTSYSSYSDSYSRNAQTYTGDDAQLGQQYESFMVKQDFPVSRMVMGYRAA